MLYSWNIDRQLPASLLQQSSAIGNMAMKKIGFCCKWLDERGTTDDKTRNTRSTTVAWLNRQPPIVAEQRLWDIMSHNLEATHKLVETVGAMDEHLRMVRLGSDILPVYTEPSWSYYWRDTAVRSHLETAFAGIGELARSHNIRLSFHPGQFTCVASDNPDIVRRSVEELEYHMDMARWMGYGKVFQDFKINIHLSGKLGVDGFNNAYSMMSSDLRNCITLENDEYQAGIDDILQLSKKVAIVLDIHHHLIHSGEYIQSTDDRIKRIQDSWRGVRPVIHYSQSRDEYLSGFINLPVFQILTESVKRGKLRAHSDMYNHKPTNDWALTHWQWADIQSESKGKNLAAIQLFKEWQAHI